MNLLLLKSASKEHRIKSDDFRFEHILKTLNLKKGESLDIGAINGPLGKGEITEIRADYLDMKCHWLSEPTPPEPAPIRLLMGISRPQTCRKVLREMTALGIREILFFASNKSEKSYRNSRLWKSDEWERHLEEGAEQGFSTYIPEIHHYSSLTDALKALDSSHEARIALDNYEATEALSALNISEKSAVYAIGSERGWSDQERKELRAYQFTLAHLGRRVLRTETAAVSSFALISGNLGYWQES